jgi:dihydrofolate reductase
MSRVSRVTLVAAVADNGVIGADGDIPWRIPEDFAHFKKLTMGGVLVMGRATYESIGRPLPGRTTIVLTRDPAWRAPGVEVARDLDEALRLAADAGGEVFVVGGAEVYRAALPRATAQVLTKVHLSPPGDTFYPSYDVHEWAETKRETHLGEAPAYEYVWYRRESPS